MLKRNRLLVIGVATAVLLLGFWQTQQLLDVPVSRIRIDGELTAAERDVVRETIAAELSRHGTRGLHSLHLDDLRVAVGSISWADRVSVRRRWPGTLHVRMSKQSVAARWGGGGYVATNGHVIMPANKILGDLPLLDCALASAPRAMAVFQLLSGRLASQGMQVVKVAESELGEWSITLANELTVVLGKNDLSDRLDRFMAMYTNIKPLQRVQIGRVDARYHNGVAVQWREADPITRMQARN